MTIRKGSKLIAGNAALNVATSSKVGAVKPDGTTIDIDSQGTISVIGTPSTMVGNGVNSMFDTVTKDHLLTYKESMGLALEGTYVYKEAILGTRYGYSDFYLKCIQEKNESTPNTVVVGSKTATIYTHSNGHQYFNITEKDVIDELFETTGNGWLYGIDTQEKRIFLPRKTHRKLINFKKPTTASNNWYNLYSDGWCEQGGCYTPTADPSYVNFVIPFKDVNYFVQLSMQDTSPADFALTTASWNSKTTTTLQIYQGYNGTSQVMPIMWEVKGYAESATEQDVKEYFYICVGNTVSDVGWVDVITQVDDGIKELQDAKEACIKDINTKAAQAGTNMCFSMFDTVLKDYVLSFEESYGLQLQGSYVYKNAIAGERYGYEDFYNTCIKEFNECKDNIVTLTLDNMSINLYKHNNGHMFYLDDNKSIIDSWFTKFGTAWFYGIDEKQERIALPRTQYFEQATLENGQVGLSVEAGLPNITGTLSPRCDFDSATGAFTRTAGNGLGHNSNYSGYSTATLNASLSSAVYGKSDTVQPNAVKKLLYICVATHIKDASWANVITQVREGVKDIQDAKQQVIEDIQDVGTILTNKITLSMFDTIKKDHALTFEESKGLALQGTYVYKNGIANSRYGYPTFYNRCVQEFNNTNNTKKWLKTYVNLVGGVTHTQGLLSGFGSGKHATITDVFNPGSDSWEIVFKCHYLTNTANQVLFDINNGSLSTRPITCYTNTSTGKFSYGFSNSTSSYTISAETAGNTLLVNDTTYFVKIEFTGTAYNCYLSTTGLFTGEEILDYTVASATPILGGYNIKIGEYNSGAAYWIGSIDLNYCYININGQRWWQGTEQLTRHHNGHLFYDINRKQQIDTIFNNTGMAWFYGVDTQNERIFLPRNVWFDQATDDVNEVLQQIEAGLPNITGSFDGNGDDGTGFKTGAFYQGNAMTGANGSQTGYYIHFDASRCSAIYGKSDTVQPNAIKKLLYICVGNTTEESGIVNITQATTEQSDCIPLFTSMYFEFEPNNACWLKAGEQRQSGNIYTFVYNELINELNTPKYGIKVIDEIDMLVGIDYSEYWKVNTDTMMFTTPTKASIKTFDTIAPVVGNGMSLGFTDGASLAGAIDNSGQIMELCAAYGKQSGDVAQSNVSLSTSAKSYEALGVTTDATKSGIETHLQENKSAQLYFKVANAIEDLQILNAGKILETTNSLIPSNKNIISTYNMPSNKYTDLSIGASGTQYTAPANGFFMLAMVVGSGNFMRIKNTYNDLFVEHCAGGSGNVPAIWLPVQKGNIIIVTYNYNGTTTDNRFRFYYAEGDIDVN